MRLALLVTVITILTLSPAGAEMYRWVDDNGAVTFRDTPPPAAKQVAAKEGRFTGMVEIYITDWCGYCKRAQAYMKEKGIPFVAYDIEKDRAAEKRYTEFHGNGVPLIVVGSRRMNGFSARGLEHLLETGGK